MTSMEKSNSVGVERLKDVHNRVTLLYSAHLDAGNSFEVEELCEYCSDFVNNSKNNRHVLEVKKVYNACSGYGWVCEGKARLFRMQVIEWKKDELLTKKKYNEIVNFMIEKYTASDAIYALDYFNRRLVVEQPHTQKIIQAAEYVIYLNYLRFQTRKGVFPVPVHNRETERNFVPFWVRREDSEDVGEDVASVNNKYNPCRQGGWGMFLRSDILNKGFEPPPGYNVLAEIRLYDLLDCEKKDLLENIDAITATPDPCRNCCKIKRASPWRTVSCTGCIALCEFKEEFFQDWPADLEEPAKCSYIVVSCTNLRLYRKLMDTVFSLTYFERCMRVKAHLDSEIVSVNVHMRKICSLYDLLLFRYFGDCAFVPEIEIVFEEGEVRESDLISDSGLSGDENESVMWE